jgi:hypothetical protein
VLTRDRRNGEETYIPPVPRRPRQERTARLRYTREAAGFYRYIISPCVSDNVLTNSAGMRLAADDGTGSHLCFFTRESARAHGAEAVDLSSVLDVNVLTLKKQVPQEFVVTTFQKMVSSAQTSRHSCSPVRRACIKYSSQRPGCWREW